MRGLRIAAVAAVALVAAAACGGGTDVSTAGPRAGDGGWRMHGLGPLAVDRELHGVAAPDGSVAVLTVDERGTVHSWQVRPGAAVTEVPVQATSTEHRSVTAVAGHGEELLAVGIDLPAYSVFVVGSSGGRSWTEVDTTGLDVPAEIHDLIASDDGYVAVGSLRAPTDPLGGAAAPAVFVSSDGLAWSTPPVPSTGAGALVSVAETDDGLLAAGSVAGRPVLWRSADGGVTWVDAAPPAEPGFGDRGVVAHAGHVLAAQFGPQMQGLGLHRSVDAGRSWDRVDASFADHTDFPTVDADPHGFSIVSASRSLRLPPTPEQCYADIEECRDLPDPEPVVLHSTDGIRWAPLDLRGLDRLHQPSSVAHTTAGDTVVLGQTTDGRWGAWVWDAEQGPPPTRDLPPLEQQDARYDGPPPAEGGATLEEGVTYRLPVGGHCGTTVLGAFNGRSWYTDDPPLVAGGAPPPAHWPLALGQIYGFITLVDAGTIAYSVDAAGEDVIAHYTPSDEPPLGCA